MKVNQVSWSRTYVYQIPLNRPCWIRICREKFDIPSNKKVLLENIRFILFLTNEMLKRLIFPASQRYRDIRRTETWMAYWNMNGVLRHRCRTFCNSWQELMDDVMSRRSNRKQGCSQYSKLNIFGMLVSSRLLVAHPGNAKKPKKHFSTFHCSKIQYIEYFLSKPFCLMEYRIFLYIFLFSMVN